MITTSIVITSSDTQTTATATSMAAMLLVHSLVMFAASSKFSNIFQPPKVKAQLRHKQRMKKHTRR